jgi:DNA-binding LytR/AlgR family response regulator
VTAGARAKVEPALRVLVVDDEEPARADLAWLLEREPTVGSVTVAGDATEALRTLQRQDIDVVFLDIRMPGLHGLDLARVLGRFATPPQVVFVTAYEQHAVEAFELRACDYLLKPVRAERLREALDRVEPHAATAGPDAAPATGAGAGTDQPRADAPRSTEATVDDLAVLMVESAGRTRFVTRRDVRFAEASGDYTRLHTADGGRHLVRIPLATLETRWAAAGFFRIHRSYLVSLQAVTEIRAATGSVVVVVEGRELPVSRRQVQAFKEAIIRSRTAGAPGRGAP